MFDWLLQPWPWYVAGPLIGLTVPLLFVLANKPFGISSSLRHIGSFCTPKSKLSYLKENNWRTDGWNLPLVAGIMLGGFIANYMLSDTPNQFLPEHYYSLTGVMRLVIGGVLVGFGTRYANGCTSGHTITGLAQLNWPSLVATGCFFIGGLLTTGLFSFIF